MQQIPTPSTPTPTPTPTPIPTTQKALLHLYGFNHHGSITSFQSAIKQNPNQCFPYWAIAYAYGPHYNAIEIGVKDYERGLEFLGLAEGIVREGGGGVRELDRDMVRVVGLRFPGEFREDPVRSMRKALIKFSQEMKTIYQKYPQNLDITAIYAQSIMNLNPWKLWHKSGQPTPLATLTRQILQPALTKPFHPQIHHLYIHLMQLSPHYKQVMPVADRLYEHMRALQEEQKVTIAHLLHMPSHIYIQVGEYGKSLEANVRAVEADVLTKQELNHQISFYQFYMAHNIHFVVWTAMFIGDYQTAISYSKKLPQVITEQVLSMFGADAQFYLSTELHVYIRFGKWQELLQTEIQTRQQYPLYKTSQRYARTIAYAVLGRIQEAQKELELFYEQKSKIKNRRYGNNTYQDVYAVAEAMAIGQLLYRKGQYQQSFTHLRKSVQLSDNLIYDQPWSWMQPPRHALGALLTEQHHYHQAKQVYEADLRTYPKNVWSLVGLDQVYGKLGLEAEKKGIEGDLAIARARAKGVVEVACFCRRGG